MSLLSRLFGGSSDSKSNVEPVPFQDFSIFVEPERADGGYRISARIEKEIGGEVKTHRMIRADVMNDADAAASASVAKAKAFIDQEGERLFGHPSA